MSVGCACDTGPESLPSNLVWYQREGDAQKIYVLPPAGARCTLVIFSKKKNETEFAHSLNYEIDALEAKAGPASFPVVYQSFTERGATLSAPLTAPLQPGSTAAFKIKVPGALKVSVVIGKTWTDLPGQGDLFSGSVAISGSPVKVVAKFAGKENFDVLMSYE